MARNRTTAQHISRRAFLRMGALAGGAVALGSLAACGQTSATPSASGQPTATSSASGSAAPPKATSASTAAATSIEPIAISSPAAPTVALLLAPIIKAKQFDRHHGLDAAFTFKPLTAYRNDYRAGTDKIGIGSAILSEAVHRNQGLPTVMLFNYFDYFGALLTGKQEVQTLKDLEGRTLTAQKTSANYAQFLYFAKKAGVDIAKIEVQNAETSGLVPAILAGRTDAVQLWEPAFSSALLQAPDRVRPIYYHQDWEKYSGSSKLPYISVAVHQDWIDANPGQPKKLYAMFKAAADYFDANLDDSLKILAEHEEAKKIPTDAFRMIVKEDRLKLNVQPISEVRKEIELVFEAGVESGYLDKVPDDGIFYAGL